MNPALYAARAIAAALAELTAARTPFTTPEELGQHIDQARLRLVEAMKYVAPLCPSRPDQIVSIQEGAEIP